MRTRLLVVVLPVALAVVACNAILGITDLEDPGPADSGSDTSKPETDSSMTDSPVTPQDSGMTPCTATPASDPCVVVVQQTALDGGGIFPTWPITFDESYWEGMGNPPGPPPNYTDNGDTVSEAVSGLTWQKHYLDAGANRLFPAAIQGCKDLGPDWRLPTRVEMATIETRKGNIETRNCLPTVFNDTPQYSWTSTGAADDPNQPPRVFYHQDPQGGCAFGSIPPSEVANANYAVRCVKGPTKDATFHVSAKADTVTAVDTGLVWERTGTIVSRIQEAKDYCQAKGMRMPVMQEIYGIIDTRVRTMFEPSLFPTLPSDAGVVRGLLSQSTYDLYPLGDGGSATRYSVVGFTRPYGDHTAMYDTDVRDLLLRCVKKK